MDRTLPSAMAPRHPSLARLLRNMHGKEGEVEDERGEKGGALGWSLGCLPQRTSLVPMTE